jgi:hypothetical protein
LPAEATGVPQEFRCAFTADRDKIALSRLDLTSDQIRMFGRGVAYYSGSVDLDFGVNVRDPKAQPDPFVDGIRGIFGENAGMKKSRVAVTGDIASPEAVMNEKGK